jgi:hypothetical protein
MDQAPDLALFVNDIQDANKKYFFLGFFVYYILEIHLYYSSKTKSHKEVVKQ